MRTTCPQLAAGVVLESELARMGLAIIGPHAAQKQCLKSLGCVCVCERLQHNLYVYRGSSSSLQGIVLVWRQLPLRGPSVARVVLAVLRNGKPNT